MNSSITIERDEDGTWVAACQLIPGCVSQGFSPDEAVANLRDAMIGCLEVRAELGLPLTVDRHGSR